MGLCDWLRDSTSGNGEPTLLPHCATTEPCHTSRREPQARSRSMVILEPVSVTCWARDVVDGKRAYRNRGSTLSSRGRQT